METVCIALSNPYFCMFLCDCKWILLRNLWSKVTLDADDLEADNMQDDEEFDDDFADREYHDGLALGEDESKVQGEEEGEDVRAHYSESFIKTVAEMITTAYKEKHPADSVLMEVKGFKFAQNKSYGEIVQGIVHAFLSIACFAGVAPPSIVLKGLKEVLNGWGHGLLDKMIQSVPDAIDIILSIQHFLLSHANKAVLCPLFRYLLQVFYDANTLSDEAILTWAEEERDRIECYPVVSDPVQQERRRLFEDDKVQEFIAWIEAEEEEDEEDEEDGDEEDEVDDDESEDN